jgi:hypothetical protein
MMTEEPAYICLMEEWMKLRDWQICRFKSGWEESKEKNIRGSNDGERVGP